MSVLSIVDVVDATVGCPSITDDSSPWEDPSGYDGDEISAVPPKNWDDNDPVCPPLPHPKNPLLSGSQPKKLDTLTAFAFCAFPNLRPRWCLAVYR